MKLVEWAQKQGVSYLTAYRWFKAGKLPVKAYQADSGTIIVQDNSEISESTMNNTSNDVMSLFLKKTVEYSKNNSSVEDFAAYILSNFSLKLNLMDNIKSSKNKPKPEDIQNHFKQFINESSKPTPNIFVDGAIQELTVDLIKDASDPTIKELAKELSSALKPGPQALSACHIYDEDNAYLTDACCAVKRTVDLTPQQFNYTSSNDCTASSSLTANISDFNSLNINSMLQDPSNTSAVISTKSELESTAKSTKLKRGRKSSKK